MALSKLVLLTCLLNIFTGVHAQQVEKHLIMTMPDSGETRPRNATIGFGPGDNYCYYSREQGALLYTKSGTYGPFKEEDGRGWAYLFYNVKGKSQYIKNMSGGTVYGPYDGEIDYASTSKISGLAYTVSAADSIVYYINGVRIAVTDSATVIGQWCTFSDNGNALYAIRQRAWSYLYFNGKLLDSSQHYYNLNDMDDAGNYWYTLGDYALETGSCNSCYSFKAIAYEAQERYGLLLLSSDNKHSYRIPGSAFSRYGNVAHAINFAGDSIVDRAYSFLKAPENGISGSNMLIKGNTIFAYTIGRKQSNLVYTADTSPIRTFINGKTKNLPYSDMYMPCIDSFGHYALFGRRGYYLYRNVDGVEVAEPLSKYGVRAMPISIDASGNSVCYYATQDSVYVYEHDQLFRSCAVAQFDFPTSNYAIWQTNNGNEPLVLKMDSVTYIVYNNTLSPPLQHARTYEGGGRSRVFRNGDIVCAKANQHGYYVIQKTGDRAYCLIINHRKMALPPGVNLEGPLWDDMTFNIRFSEKEFLFYSLEGKKLYRYKMEL